MYLRLPGESRSFGENRSDPWAPSRAYQPPFANGLQPLHATDEWLRRRQLQRRYRIAFDKVWVDQTPWHWIAPQALGQLIPEASGASFQQLEQQYVQAMKKAMEEISARLQDEMKKEMLKTAAVQTGISVALNVIPVAGWAASAIVSVALSISSGKYQREAEAIMADASEIVAREQAKSQARISAMLDEVFEQEKQAAIQLAISGRPLPATLDGLLDFVKDAVSPIQKFMKELSRGTHSVIDELERFGGRIEDEVDRFGETIQEDVLDPISGRTVKIKAREGRERIIAEAKAKLREHENNLRELINSAAYRENLRVEIARTLRNNPAIQRLTRQRLEIEQQMRSPSVVPSYDTGETGTAAKILPIAAAGIAALIALGT